MRNKDDEPHPSDNLPTLRVKENKRIKKVYENNLEFQKYINNQKNSFERMAKRVEELSKIKGTKNKIVEYVESKHRMRRLINQIN